MTTIQVIVLAALAVGIRAAVVLAHTADERSREEGDE